MSMTLPSKQVTVVDMPEVQGFAAKFTYGFFTADESVNETGGVPVSVLERSASDIDSTFIQFASTRAPRYVTFTLKPPIVNNVSRIAADAKAATFGTNVERDLIANNLAKVVTEDQFCSNDYVALNFHDGELEDKVHVLVSGAFMQQTLESGGPDDISHYAAAQSLYLQRSTNTVMPSFLFRYLLNPSTAFGAQFFDSQGDAVENSFYGGLHDVLINAQVNSRLLEDIVGRTVRDPLATYGTDLSNVLNVSRHVGHTPSKSFSTRVSEADYKTNVSYVDVRSSPVASLPDRDGPRFVGFIIDKSEILGDGTTKQHDPIIVDNERATTTADYRVRYNATYVYSVRAVYLFKMPSVDDVTGDVAMLSILVSSRPSNVVTLATVDTVAPPPPTDLGFTWDYERVNPLTADHDALTGQPYPGTGQHGSLLVHWTFPPNSQRDVKKFQVFRRKTIDEPFELIKMYDFDDSMVKAVPTENPSATLVENIVSPCNFLFDDDFLVTSKYTYAVACIDAHGMTSAYSEQYEVTFDQFQNRLQKKMVSHAGAPKSYPNMYLQADLFVDTVRVAGPNTRQARLFFNPQSYYVYDNDGSIVPLLATVQGGGEYKLNVINLDNQKSVTVNVGINDQTTSGVQSVALADVKFGG